MRLWQFMATLLTRMIKYLTDRVRSMSLALLCLYKKKRSVVMLIEPTVIYIYIPRILRSIRIWYRLIKSMDTQIR